MDGEYKISNGMLGDYEIPLSGTKPASGKLTYENNILKSGCLTFDDYKVTIENGNIETPEKGTCDENTNVAVIPPDSCFTTQLNEDGETLTITQYTCGGNPSNIETATVNKDKIKNLYPGLSEEKINMLYDDISNQLSDFGIEKFLYSEYGEAAYVLDLTFKPGTILDVVIPSNFVYTNTIPVYNEAKCLAYAKSFEMSDEEAQDACERISTLSVDELLEIEDE